MIEEKDNQQEQDDPKPPPPPEPEQSDEGMSPNEEISKGESGDSIEK